MPLFRVGDLDTLRENAGIDWETVRGCRPGEHSPLLGLLDKSPGF